MHWCTQRYGSFVDGIDNGRLPRTIGHTPCITKEIEWRAFLCYYCQLGRCDIYIVEFGVAVNRSVLFRINWLMMFTTLIYRRRSTGTQVMELRIGLIQLIMDMFMEGAPVLWTWQPWPRDAGVLLSQSMTVQHGVTRGLQSWWGSKCDGKLIF